MPNEDYYQNINGSNPYFQLSEKEQIRLMERDRKLRQVEEKERRAVARLRRLKAATRLRKRKEVGYHD